MKINIARYLGAMLLILFMEGCSFSAPYTINDKDLLQYAKAEEDIYVGMEKMDFLTNYMNVQCNNIISFEDMVFIKNTGYQYINGEYHLSGKNLTDYLPEEDRAELLELIENHVWRILQSKNTIIYTTNKLPEGYKVTLVDFPTGEIKGSSILPAEMQCVYEDKLYYIYSRKNNLGNEIYVIEYLDCNDFSKHEIYSNDSALGQMMVRSDGAIVFAVSDEGYYIIDAEGNLKLLHETIEDRLKHAKEQFYMFDSNGLLFWIEYYNHATEMLFLEENGLLHRLKINDMKNEIVFSGGILIHDGSEANLYPHQYETREVEDLSIEEEIIQTSPLRKFQIIDIKYTKSDFKLIDAYYQNQIIWWLWADSNDKLIVTKLSLE